MVYVIAGVLLGAAVMILTLPWSTRDTADFSLMEFGYVWRGPRGAIAGALRVLHDRGAVKPTYGGMARQANLPRGSDPFVRAVFGGLDVPRGPAALLELPSVEEQLPQVAERVMAARLRVGPARRAVGSLAALVAPVMALVALGHGVGSIVAGIVTVVVSVIVAGWLGALHGITIAGVRALSTAPGFRRRSAGRSGGLAQATSISGLWLVSGAATDGGFGIAVSDSGGHHGGDISGGHHGG